MSSVVSQQVAALAEAGRADARQAMPPRWVLENALRHALQETGGPPCGIEFGRVIGNVAPLAAGGVPLRVSLARMLHQAGLSFRVHGGYVVIGAGPGYDYNYATAFHRIGHAVIRDNVPVDLVREAVDSLKGKR